MAKQEAGYDYDRYRKLLAEAVDETRRRQLIDLLIELCGPTVRLDHAYGIIMSPNSGAS